MNIQHRWNHEADAAANRINTHRTITFTASNGAVLLTVDVTVPCVPQAVLSGSYINAVNDLREFVEEMLPQLEQTDFSDVNRA